MRSAGARFLARDRGVYETEHLPHHAPKAPAPVPPGPGALRSRYEGSNKAAARVIMESREQFDGVMVEWARRVLGCC